MKNQSKVILAIGLGFGDEGKGSVTSYLAQVHNAKLVCRFNGGGQAAHSVTKGSKHHIFSQWGSGTFEPGCDTFLSKYMLVQPGAMLSEAKHLESVGIADPFKRMFIEDCALVTTRFHMAVNRLREMHRSKNCHGSCGMGINETVVDSQEGLGLHVAGMQNPSKLRAQLKRLQGFNRAKVEDIFKALPESADRDREWLWLNDPSKVEAEAETCEAMAKQVKVVGPSWLKQQLQAPGTVLFEGAQGVLLDQFSGFMPHCTRSNTTFANADALLKECNFEGQVTRMGILRTYLTRHGDGPLPTEDPGLLEGREEPYNTYNSWQHGFRAGHFDLVLLRYAIKACRSIDTLAITHMDKLAENPKVCIAYKGQPEMGLPTSLAEQHKLNERLEIAEPVYTTSKDFIDTIEAAEGVPVSLLSFGPTTEDKVKCETRRKSAWPSLNTEI